MSMMRTGMSTPHGPCPVCGNNAWYPDYDWTGEDEVRVDRCEVCEWPPNAPMSVEEWRNHPHNPINGSQS